MIDFLLLFKIFVVLLLALMSPGPNFVLVSNIALSRGRAAGVQCALGMGAADFVYAGLSLLGLGLLLKELPQVMIFLEVAGGLYLIYIGVHILRSTFQKKKSSTSTAETPKKRERNPCLHGFLASAVNPKVIIFYGSIFTVAMQPNSNTATKICLPFFCALISFFWYGFVAVTLSAPRLRTRYQKWAKVIDRCAGTILLLFGAMLALSDLF